LRGLGAGADDYLIKPFSARELFARVSSAIALRAARRKATDAAREESARIRNLFEQAPGFIAILNGPEHRFEFANESYRKLVGERELIGRSIREAFPELVGQGFFELLDRVYRTQERFVGERVPVRLSAPRGEPLRELYVDFIYEPVVDESGSSTGIFVEGYEVTERVRAEAELRESESRFRTFAENIPTMCWMARPDGHIFWYNSRWFEYTGTTLQDQEGWGWQSVHDPKMLPTVMEAWRHSIASGESFEMTFPLKGANGEFRPFLTRVVPVRDESGKVARWFGTNTDVTAQQQYEQHLQTLIDELNHRVKNTLAVVQSLAAQTFRQPVDIPSARKNFESRLMALSSAHTLLTRETWKGAGLRHVLNASLDPFIDKASCRLGLQGPLACTRFG
jgi:PAS domain S-box-containing protein